MKKSLIAMSAAAALGSFGLVGTAAAQMAVNNGGIGHQLVFPYFTTQGDNATSIAIVNTDTTNGKVVKVRFRGARNSDDLLDFQVLMSPGDVWTAAVTRDATSGKSVLTTSDSSCTVPKTVRTGRTEFVTARLDPASDLAAQTREGYIEIITMADIKPSTSTTSLFYTIKHRSGVADCSDTIINRDLASVQRATGGSAATEVAVPTSTATTGSVLMTPTASLAGDYIIVQSTNRAAWSGSATALRAGSAFANLVYWPQSDAQIVSSGLDKVGPNGVLTSDPLMGTDTNVANNMVTLRQYDLPDLSTPYDPNATYSGDQLVQLISALRTTTTSNQYETSASIGGLTDIVFAQPARRYQVAVNYKAASASAPTTVTGTAAGAVFTNPFAGATAGTAGPADSTFTNNPLSLGGATGNTVFNASRTLCLNNATLAPIYDREETTNPSSFVVSPGEPTLFLLCGEVAVTSINSVAPAASALNAELTRNSVVVPYSSGWLTINTERYGSYSGSLSLYNADPLLGGTGIPFLGAAFVRASNASQGQNYGFTFGNKTTTN